MSFASSNRTALRFIKESTFGVTPATPVFQALRFTGESLNYNLSNITSNEIRDDRQRSALVQVQSDAAGDLNIEMSYNSYDEFLQAAFASAWGTATDIVDSLTISAVAADNSLNSSGTEFANLVVGQWIKLTSTTNNGYGRVATQTSAKITLTGITLADESAGTAVSVSGTMMRNGTTLLSYTIQKALQDSTVPTYMNFTGARCGGLDLSYATGQIVTGAFKFMALGANVSETQITGATVVPATTTEVMNAVGNISAIYLNDSQSTAFFNTLSLSINNNLRSQDAIGSLPHVGIALGSLDVTGDINLYFEDKTMYDLYLNASAFSLAFVMEDASGNAYVFTLPYVKFESGEVVAGGLDTDVMMQAGWRAILDPTTLCTAQVDKL